MNRINRLFSNRKKNILSVYFTAGFPSLDTTTMIINELSEAGVDMIEIGIPFSDPVADGPVIQRSSEKALQNGMSLERLFRQLQDIRKKTDIPLLLMGYFNPVLRYGVERFAEDCSRTGIDGTIIPDLPVEEYKGHYEKIFERNDLLNIFLLTPQSTDERIRYLDEISRGFLYVVSSSSTTGTRKNFTQSSIEYFTRLDGMNLKTPRLTGFGISDRNAFNQACMYSSGAIIGSAFIKALGETGSLRDNIKRFAGEFL